MTPPDALMIDYLIELDDGPVRIPVRLHPESLSLMDEPARPPPPWTELSRNCCPVCRLPPHTRFCPVAASIGSIVTRFNERRSFDRARLRVVTEERTYEAETTLQGALTSLIGIYMVTAGCPSLDKLRPMVRFHLPLASEHETVYRAASMYLVAQFLRARRGEAPDWTMNGLSAIYDEVREVNRAFARRVREAARHDANANAVVRLDLFADGVAHSMRHSLDDLEYLFVPTYLR